MGLCFGGECYGTYPLSFCHGFSANGFALRAQCGQDV